ncbi:MAG: anti-sigma F factor antagonist [Clostridium sp.]|nr:anti-sigma F factor antagonist [Clostridium sp.]MCI7443721.1 anti-sigma F factor antagonist [Clostridium sp.]
MHLKFDKYNDVLIVYLFGELDHHNAEILRVKIDDRIDREGIKKVILSFQGVSFMDSSGIGAVIGRYKKINSKGGSLCVVDIDERINRVFELSGLYKIIKQYKNIDEALKVI